MGKKPDPKVQPKEVELPPILVNLPDEVLREVMRLSSEVQDFRKRLKLRPRPGVNQKVGKKNVMRVSVPFVRALFARSESEKALKTGLGELLTRLSEKEYRAVNAVLRLVEEKKEFVHDEFVHSQVLQGLVTQKIITIPLREFYKAYYEAYGLKKTKKGYDSKAKAVALSGLKSLHEKEFLVPFMIPSEDGKWRIEHLERVPLIRITGETNIVFIGEDTEKAEKYITLSLHWILTYGLEKFFTLRRKDKNAIIDKVTKNRSEKYAILRLTDYLETLDLSAPCFSEARLAEILSFKSLLKKREKTKLRTRILRILELTKQAGWIKDYSVENDAYILILNPDFCVRVRSGEVTRGETGHLPVETGGTYPWRQGASPDSEIGFSPVFELSLEEPGKYISKYISNYPGSLHSRDEKKGGKK